jgi:hypothetical protein
VTIQATLHNFRGLALGVLNGALYSVVQFLLVSAYFDYRTNARSEMAQDLGLPQMQPTELVNARIVSIWFVLFFDCFGLGLEASISKTFSS